MKKIYIITLSAIAMFVILGGVVYAFNLNNEDKSTITSDHYYVAKGMEKVAESVKPAIESFVNQDKSESAASRNRRLSNYFTKDSKVYTYSLNNLSPNIDKTQSKLTSVVKYGGGDDILIVSAMVYVDFYSKGNFSYSHSETYLVSFKENPDKSISKPYDIEEQL